MCAELDKLNEKSIQGIQFKKIAENHHGATTEGDSSHILKCKDCPLYCFFEAQRRRLNLIIKTNVLSWPEKSNFITYSHKQAVCK